jgi:acyl-CoA thioesterase-1
MLKLKNKQLIPNFNTTIKKFFLKFCYFSMLTLFVACGAEPKNKTKVEPTVNTTHKTEGNVTTKKTIMFFGDSLTAGYGLDAIEDAFPNLIQQNIDSLSLNYTVINSGVSGETSSGGKNRIDWVLTNKVDVFVLELGANDGLRGVPLKETKQNLQAIIDVVRKKNPKTKIVLTGMQIPPNMGIDYTTEFKTIFPDLAKKNNIPLIPFLLKDVGGIPSLNQADGIHPTKEGHKILAKNVWEVLEAIL